MCSEGLYFHLLVRKGLRNPSHPHQDGPLGLEGSLIPPCWSLSVEFSGLIDCTGRSYRRVPRHFEFEVRVCGGARSWSLG